MSLSKFPPYHRAGITPPLAPALPITSDHLVVNLARNPAPALANLGANFSDSLLKIGPNLPANFFTADDVRIFFTRPESATVSVFLSNDAFKPAFATVLEALVLTAFTAILFI